MGVIVYFYPAKNKHQSVLRTSIPECRNNSTIRECITLQDDNYIYYYTYLNSGLLEAPREYVLYALVPGLN
jgi:hypothetical protein